MKETISGKNKIQQICDLLKKETIEPAKQEASEVLENAHMQVAEILEKARLESEELLRQAEKQIEQKRQAFESSLFMAGKQGLEALKQQIETQLFNEGLEGLVSKSQVDPQVISKLIEVIIQAIEKDGVSSDLTVAIGKNFEPRKINELLSKGILDSLREKAVVLGGFANGIEVKIHQKKITLDLTDQALTDLISQFIRKDFRDFFFQKR